MNCEFGGERLGPEAAKAQWRRVGRPAPAKLAAFMDEAEDHWAKIHSTNGLKRLNGEVKRRTEVVGIFPMNDAIVRLVGAILLEQNDEWALQRARYITLETMSAMIPSSGPPWPSEHSASTGGPRRTPSATPRPETRSITRHSQTLLPEHVAVNRR
jgi:hypothetical protein